MQRPKRIARPTALGRVDYSHGGGDHRGKGQHGRNATQPGEGLAAGHGDRADGPVDGPVS
ncbi:MAG: hypothetical protein ABI780_07850 [Ardenticatenales bacterium]